MHILFKVALAAALAVPGCAFAQTSKKAVPPAGLQAEFDGFFVKFRAAAKANDSAAIAAMTELPFQKDDSFRDAALFRAKAYPTIFTAQNRACLQRKKGVYDRDGQGNENFFVFCGEDIFVFGKTPSGFLFKEIGSND